MTTAEACDLVVDLTRELALTRGERDAYRLLAQQAIHYAADLQRELARLEDRYHRLLDERRLPQQQQRIA